MRLIHWLAARINAALDRLTHYADPWPVCQECGQTTDPNGEGHAATCRPWGTA